MKVIGRKGGQSHRSVGYGNGVHWYDHVLRREDGRVLRMVLDFKSEGHRKKGRPKS